MCLRYEAWVTSCHSTDPKQWLHPVFTYLLQTGWWEFITVSVSRSGETNSSSNIPTNPDPSTHHPPSMGRSVSDGTSTPKIILRIYSSLCLRTHESCGRSHFDVGSSVRFILLNEISQELWRKDELLRFWYHLAHKLNSWILINQKLKEATSELNILKQDYFMLCHIQKCVQHIRYPEKPKQQNKNPRTSVHSAPLWMDCSVLAEATVWTRTLWIRLVPEWSVTCAAGPVANTRLLKSNKLRCWKNEDKSAQRLCLCRSVSPETCLETCERIEKITKRAASREAKLYRSLSRELSTLLVTKCLLVLFFVFIGEARYYSAQPDLVGSLSRFVSFSWLFNPLQLADNNYVLMEFSLLVFVMLTCSLASVCRGAKADVLFLIDGSWSIGEESFTKIMHFVSGMIAAFDVIGPSGMQVCVQKMGKTVARCDDIMLQ